MTNAGYTEIGQYRDIESLNYFNILKQEGKSEQEIYEILGKKSRDNSRTPMQWDDTEQAGFTDGTPWISVIQNYKEINTLDRNREDSIFQYYKKLIELRKTYPVIADGTFEALLEDHPQILAYKRANADSELYVFCNYYPGNVEIPMEIPGDCRIILSNYPRSSRSVLRPYEAVMLYREIGTEE